MNDCGPGSGARGKQGMHNSAGARRRRGLGGYSVCGLFRVCRHRLCLCHTSRPLGAAVRLVGAADFYRDATYHGGILHVTPLRSAASTKEMQCHDNM